MKILKILGIGFLSLVIMIVIGTILVTNLLSAFGEAPNAEFQAGYQSSNNFTDEEFVNETTSSAKQWQENKKNSIIIIICRDVVICRFATCHGAPIS